MATKAGGKDPMQAGDNTRPKRTYPHSTGDRNIMRDHGVEDRDYEGGVQRQPNVDRPRDGSAPKR